MPRRSLFASHTGRPIGRRRVLLFVVAILACAGMTVTPASGQSAGGTETVPDGGETLAPSPADQPAPDDPPTERRSSPRILFLEDVRNENEPPTDDATADEPEVDFPDDVFFIPDNPDGGLLPPDEIFAAPYIFEHATVGLTYESIRSLRQMELDYRAPGWPRTVDSDRMGGVMTGSGEENPALPDSTISFTYRLAPYVVDYGDHWQAQTPITWELLQTGKAKRIRYRDGFHDVERAMAGSLASVGHITEAEDMGLKAYTRRKLLRGIGDPLVQRSVLMLIRLYQVADRSEASYYRDLGDLGDRN